MGKQQHVANAGAVGEEHDQAVYADAFACRGRQSVLERADVIGVVVHRFLVALGLGLGLLLEPRCLILGIVQFGETVGDFSPRDVQLEAVGQLGIGVAAPRK